jgi:hypothetical protein
MLLCVLWARSYWQWDEFTLNDGVNSLGSKSGNVYLFQREIGTHPTRPYGWPSHSGGEITKSQNAFKWQPPFGQLMGVSFPLPYWFPVAMSAGLAATPWLRWRFSLRTLLIATTLVAAVLGLGVYAARK